ncbi:MAG: superfamily inner rane transporter protein [Rhizobium sp.]|nr:superfamily inner rane transporter protein [Rhizobium sp.]
MKTQNSLQISATGWVMLLVLGLLWGGSFFFARVAVPHIPPFTLALLRFVIAALCLHVFIAGRFGIYQEFRARWPSFLLLGLINNAIPHACIFLGQTHIGAGLASILNATTPIWTVIIAHFLTSDERLTGLKIAGTLTGLAGTVLLFSPHVAAKAGVPAWALALPVVAAISYGFAGIYARRFRGVAAPVTAAGQLTASTIIMLPVSMLVDQPWTLPWPPFDAVASVLALAIISTAVAYILFFRLITMAGATNASLVTLLVPPSAILLGILFLGERLGAAEWTGMLVIGIGLVILDGRLVARFATRET